MAFDAFIKLDGIAGESTDSKHKGEIEVLSFSWNIKQPITISSDGGGGTGVPHGACQPDPQPHG